MNGNSPGIRWFDNDGGAVSQNFRDTLRDFGRVVTCADDGVGADLGRC